MGEACMASLNWFLITSVSETGWRFPRGAALLGQIVAILAAAGPGEQPFISQPCLRPGSHLGPAGGWEGRTLPGHAFALPAAGSALCECAKAGGAPAPAFGPCSVGLDRVHDRPTGRATALTFAFFPLPQQLQTDL